MRYPHRCTTPDWRQMLIVVLLLTPPLPATVPAAHDTPVASVTVTAPNAHPRFAHAARAAAGIREGERFDARTIEHAMENLTLTGWFSSIALDTVHTSQGVQVTVQVEAADVVGDVHIRGAWPLFSSEIRDAMSLRPGTPFDSTAIGSEASSLEEYLIREGFPRPRVGVVARPLRGGRGQQIRVEVEPGSYWKAEHINVRGNMVRGNPGIKLRTRSWRLMANPFTPNRFLEQTLRRDVDNLTSFYRRKGFADVAIASSLAHDTSRFAVGVELSIDEGPRYDLSVSSPRGPTILWRRAVRQVIREEGNRGRRGERAAVRVLRERLLEQGYRVPQITVTDTLDTLAHTPWRYLDFSVDRGARTRVGSVVFDGVDEHSPRELRRHTLTRPRRPLVVKTLEEDRVALHGFLVAQGHLAPSVETATRLSQDSTTAEVVFAVAAGPRTLVESVEVSGSTLLDEATLTRALGTAVGKPFQRSVLRRDENRLSEQISDKGYPFVTIDSHVELTPDSTGAAVTLVITQGTAATMGSVYTAGNIRTRSRVLQRTLGVKTGNPFSLRTLLEGQREVRRMGIFHTVTFRTFGLREQRDSIHLFVQVEEKRPRYLEAAGGFESDNRTFAKFTYGNSNLFGTNRSAWISGESGNIDRWVPDLIRGSTRMVDARGEVGLLQHRLAGTRTSATFDGYAEQRIRPSQAYGYRRYGSNLGLGRQWLPSLRSAAGLTYERRIPFRNPYLESTPEVIGTESPRNLLRISPQSVYDSRNSFIRPARGNLLSLTVDVHKGIDNRRDDFVLLDLDMRHFRTVRDYATLALRTRGGILVPYGGQSVLPPTQLLYLGGTRSVRGFREDQLWTSATDAQERPSLRVGRGGDVALSATVELRWPLPQNLELSTFIDAGQVLSRYPHPAQSPLRAAAGAGLGYHTPIGPITLMYALKLRRAGYESPGSLHFSLGYTF